MTDENLKFSGISSTRSQGMIRWEFPLVDADCCRRMTQPSSTKAANPFELGNLAPSIGTMSVSVRVLHWHVSLNFLCVRRDIREDLVDISRGQNALSI